MSSRALTKLYVGRWGAVLSLTLLGAAACGGNGAENDAAPTDSTSADSTRAPATDVVALVDLPIRSAPAVSADAIRDIVAGTGLALVRPEAGAAPPPAGWVQVSTWDDRRGWVPEADLLDIALWSHYQAALGGTPPTGLRPAYPAQDEGWVVEAPFHSPGFSTIATVWLAGDTLFQTRVADIDSLDNECSGDRYRFARLAAGPGATTYPGAPDLDAAVLAVASVARPTLKRLGIRPLDAPDPAFEAVVARAAQTLLAGTPDTTGSPAGPAPAPGALPVATWYAVGDAAIWVTLTWEPEADAMEFGRWAGAMLVIPATQSGDPPRVQTAIPLTATSVGESSEPFDVRAAYSTGPGLHPTLFVVHSLHYEGLNVNVYLAAPDALRRVHLGYYWGC